MRGERYRKLLQKRKRQRPKSLAHSSLTISQREWISVSGFPLADSLGLRRASRPPSLLSVELPACAFRSSSGLPLAERPACAGCSSSGSSGGQASGLRLSLVPSGPSGSPGSSDLRRLPWAPGFLWLALPILIGRSVLRPCAFDRLPASIAHSSSEFTSGQLPARAFCWVRRLLQRFTYDLLLVHQLDRHYGSATCARKCKSCRLCG
jgi:hypothetical protein